jgi:hypothetical protein
MVPLFAKGGGLAARQWVDMLQGKKAQTLEVCAFYR